MDKLPFELIDQIAIQLDSGSFCAFRQVSRRYAQGCSEQFIARIRSLRFCLSPWSLPTLLSIARDPVIAPKIECVRLIDCFLDDDEETTDYIDDLKHRATSSLQRKEHMSRMTMFNEYLAAQKKFQEGDDLIMLTEILRSLPNLRSVGLDDWEGSPKRIPDDEADLWWDDDSRLHWEDDYDFRIYGVTTVVNATFKNIFMRGEHGVFHNFNTILNALQLSQRPIEGIYGRKQGFVLPYIDLRDVPPLQPAYAHGLSVALSQLRELQLSLGLSGGDGDGPQNLSPDGTRWLANLVGLAPQLEVLNLFLCTEMLESERIFHELAQGSRLPRLKTFVLRFACISGADLMTFLNAHVGTIKHISLQSLTLSDDRWSNFLSDRLKSVGQFDGSIHLADLRADKEPTSVDVVKFDTELLDECPEHKKEGHTCKVLEWKDIQHLQSNMIQCGKP